MANLPPIQIPDADIPRLRVALKAIVNDPTGSMTAVELYKKFVIGALTDAISNFERKDAVDSAIANLPPPPPLT